MRVLLTGATGFIGKHLRPALERRGHTVTPVSRADWPLDGTVFPARLLAAADAVVHLAGEPVAQRWTDAARSRILETRALATAALARGLAPHQVLVAASAVGYYGDRAGELLAEDSTPGSDFLAWVCREWESAAALSRGRTASLRIGVVLGRGGGALAKMLTPFRLGLGGRLGSGRQWMSWIHIDDLTAALCHALETQELSGPVNATAPNPVTNQEFTRVLADTLHRPALFPVPALALRLTLGEMSQVLLSSQRALPTRLLETGFGFRFPALGAALAEVLRPAGMLK
jgi:uncharacterized protein (TIGR01777 family)